MFYGYARVSTKKQSLERQTSNIKEHYPDAVIMTEAYTGTKIDRPQFSKLLRLVKPGDTIIFDEVSRMSRNADEGFKTYQSLYEQGVNLVFIKEPHINSEVFRNAYKNRIEAHIQTGNNATDIFTATILEAVNKLLMDLAKEQIELAFQKAQEEVDHLHVRTAEGMKAAGATNVYDESGNLIMQGSISKAKQGKTLTTKKSIIAKEIIRKHSKSFNGSLNDIDCMKLAGLSRNTYYKYKSALMNE